MPRGCVVHMPQISYSLWCIPTPLATISDVSVLYISAWGFGVARFDRQGNAKASEREASNNAGLHAFFCIILQGKVSQYNARIKARSNNS